MNLLNNRDVLKSLLYQGDQLNTLSGGITQVNFDIENKEDGFLIKVHAPGISAESMKIISDQQTLQIFATLNHPAEKIGVMVPLFYRKVNLPIFANTEAVEAVHQGNNLEIFIPIGKDSSSHKKEIEIKQL